MVKVDAHFVIMTSAFIGIGLVCGLTFKEMICKKISYLVAKRIL